MFCSSVFMSVLAKSPSYGRLVTGHTLAYLKPAGPSFKYTIIHDIPELSNPSKFKQSFVF